MLIRLAVEIGRPVFRENWSTSSNKLASKSVSRQISGREQVASHESTLACQPGGGFTKLNTWDRIKAKLNLPDFSPESQDRAAVEIFSQFGALADIQAGRVLEAARKLRSQWASLPGAGYGQGERNQSYVLAKYAEAGGALA